MAPKWPLDERETLCFILGIVALAFYIYGSATRGQGDIGLGGFASTFLLVALGFKLDRGRRDDDK